MAKKIFCDICGDEMTYEDVPDVLKNRKVPVIVKGHGNRTIQFEVAVEIRPVADNGEHIDACHDCRWFLLDKLDYRPREKKESSIDDAEASTKL